MAKSDEVTPCSYGVLVGDINNPVAFGLSPDSLENDPAFSEKLLHAPLAELESGIQMHIFTSPTSLLILRLALEKIKRNELEQLKTAIKLNQIILKELIGKELAPPENFIIVNEAINFKSIINDCRETCFSIRKGAVNDTLVKIYKKGKYSILIPSVTPGIAVDLGINNLINYSFSVKVMNNKNLAIPLLHKFKIRVPETTCFENNLADLSHFRAYHRLVFKAAESAGGVGIFLNRNRGYTTQQIVTLVNILRKHNNLPRYFQIQELIKGRTYGIIAMFHPDRRFKIEGIYEQVIDRGEFIGAYWNKECEQQFMPVAIEILENFSHIESLFPLGPVNIDVIIDNGGNYYVLEVNMRYSGASSIIFMKNYAADHPELFPEIRTIELYTRCKVLPKVENYNSLLKRIFDIRDKFGSLIIPQGINPFSTSKLLFINDFENIKDSFLY
jgi:hypothetical protein